MAQAPATQPAAGGGDAPGAAAPPGEPAGVLPLPPPDDVPPPGSSIVILMTAIAQQDKWILSQGRLESEGCAFMYSLQGSSYMITPRGDRLRLGRDRERMPLLHERFTTPGMIVACGPDSTEADVVGLLIDTGATIHIAGNGWDAHLNPLPGVGMSARAVGGGVSVSLGRGLLELDLRAGTGSPTRTLDSCGGGKPFPGALVPRLHA